MGVSPGVLPLGCSCQSIYGYLDSQIRDIDTRSNLAMIKIEPYSAVRSWACALMTGLAALIAAPSPASADQFVLFDATFTYTKEDADNSKPSKSHYYVKGDMLNPDRP